MAQLLSPENTLYKVIQGAFRFRSEVFPAQQSFFESLALGQHPQILFITCSDSRVDASLITQTQPGDMFLIHNAGNIVPPLAQAFGGVGASIEYAVSVLNVKHIIICGHSQCGAMEALLNEEEDLHHYPTVQRWLSYADAAKAILQHSKNNMRPIDRLNQCIEINVQVQLGHLKTLPSVAAKLYHNEVSLHGWVYNIETGRIKTYDQEKNTFIALEDAYILTNECTSSSAASMP